MNKVSLGFTADEEQTIRPEAVEHFKQLESEVTSGKRCGECYSPAVSVVDGKFQCSECVERAYLVSIGMQYRNWNPKNYPDYDYNGLSRAKLKNKPKKVKREKIDNTVPVPETLMLLQEHGFKFSYKEENGNRRLNYIIGMKGVKLSPATRSAKGYKLYTCTADGHNHRLYVNIETGAVDRIHKTVSYTTVSDLKPLSQSLKELNELGIEVARGVWKPIKNSMDSEKAMVPLTELKDGNGVIRGYSSRFIASGTRWNCFFDQDLLIHRIKSSPYRRMGKTKNQDEHEYWR